MNIKQVLIGATISASALAANAAQTVGLNNVPGNPNAWTFFGAVPDLADTTFTFDPVDTLSGQYDTLLTFGFGGFGFGATSFTVTLDGTPLSYDSNSGSYTFQGVLDDQLHGIQLQSAGYSLGIASTTITVSAVPVPEPESYAMMLAGLGALGFMARRRKTK